jgi:SAM-dependent methyltransferase
VRVITRYEPPAGTPRRSDDGNDDIQMRRTVELLRHHVPGLQQIAGSLKKIIADALATWHGIERGRPMEDRQAKNEKARGFFDDIWREGDVWQLETSDFEREKYAHQLNFLKDRRYARALEIGCGSGRFSLLLASVADEVVALDVSSLAIERARSLSAGAKGITFEVANIMEYDPVAAGPWELIVISETIYYLGWLYSVVDVARLAMRLFEATREGGRLLMCNSEAGEKSLPPIIRTYRDLMLNVGYRLAAEDRFRGSKNGREQEALVSYYTKP